MHLAVAIGEDEARGQSIHRHWIVEQVREYPELQLRHYLGHIGADTNLEQIDGLVVDAAHPTESMRKQMVAAHRLGKPVLAFVSMQCPDTEIIGDMALPQSRPYPLAEWLSLFGDKKKAITVSRGMMRDLKLRIWLRGHFGLVHQGTEIEITEE